MDLEDFFTERFVTASVCPILDKSSSMYISCTNTNFRGSMCEISCKEDMILMSQGSAVPEQFVEVECTEEGWSRDIPNCQSMSCPRLQRLLQTL